MAHHLTPTGRLAVLAGPAAALLLLAGLFGDAALAASSTDAAVTSWLAGADDGGWLLTGTLDGLGALALLIYAQVLAARLAGPGHAVAGRLVAALGAVAGAAGLVGGALYATVPIGRIFLHAPDPDPSAYRYLLAASAAVLVVFLALPAAGMVAVASVVGLRAATMPRWLAVSGLVLAVLMIASALVAPLLVLGVWLLLSGTALAVTAPRRVDVPV